MTNHTCATHGGDDPRVIDSQLTGRPRLSVLMTVREVLFETRLSRTTLYLAVKEGALPIVKIGRATRFLRTDFDAWMASLSANGATSNSATGSVPAEPAAKGE